MNYKTLPIPFLLLSLPSLAMATPVSIDRLEASVNSTLILKSDVRKFRDTLSLRGQLDPLFTGTSVATKGNQATDLEITEFLVDEKLIVQQFPITDAEVEQEISSIQSNNKIDRPGLKSALQEQGFSFEDYFELIRDSAAKRNLIDRDIRTKVSISDDDVKNHFYNHISRGTAAPMAYKVKIIAVSPSNFKTPTMAKDTIQTALQAVRAGETFEEVARRTSDDASASNGGDLGTLTEDQMSETIRSALKKMQIGQVSEVLGDLRTRLYFLKLVDLTSTENERLKKMTDEIRNQLASSEYQHQITLWIERQRQGAFIHRAGEPSVSGLAKP